MRSVSNDCYSSNYFIQCLLLMTKETHFKMVFNLLTSSHIRNCHRTEMRKLACFILNPVLFSLYCILSQFRYNNGASIYCLIFLPKKHFSMAKVCWGQVKWCPCLPCSHLTRKREADNFISIWSAIYFCNLKESWMRF